MAQKSVGTAKPKRQRGPGKPFKPGADPRRNAGGRPRGLASRIRAEVGEDGEELVKAMLTILRSPESSQREVIDAATWLADRAFGRPKQTLEHTGSDGEPLEVRLSFDPQAK